MVILALDVGAARIGVAVCDAAEVLASPRGAIQRKTRKGMKPLAATLDEIAQLVAETGAELVVMGLPVSLDGQLHDQARNVQSFGERLRKRVSVPLVYADETLTTVRAEELLREAGVRPQQIRERIDAAAAAVILQDYLDARHKEQT